MLWKLQAGSGIFRSFFAVIEHIHINVYIYTPSKGKCRKNTVPASIGRWGEGEERGGGEEGYHYIWAVSLYWTSMYFGPTYRGVKTDVVIVGEADGPTTRLHVCVLLRPQKPEISLQMSWCPRWQEEHLANAERSKSTMILLRLCQLVFVLPLLLHGFLSFEKSMESKL